MPTLPPLKYPLKTKNSAKLSYLKLATSELTSEPALTLTPAPALTPTSNLVNKKIADLRMVLLDYFIIKMIIFSKHSMYGKEILQKLLEARLDGIIEDKNGEEEMVKGWAGNKAD